ncbi:MAG: hypothetical protein CVV49_07140 [Spirochaetae bacterium HGW-Spirochaetae-5]|nr:MAG: hypothetical protein CVV49_07140 [Spirochaetae bacterium HGW-Spirochaetae-5]
MLEKKEILKKINCLIVSVENKIKRFDSENIHKIFLDEIKYHFIFLKNYAQNDLVYNFNNDYKKYIPKKIIFTFKYFLSDDDIISDENIFGLLDDYYNFVSLIYLLRGDNEKVPIDKILYYPKTISELDFLITELKKNTQVYDVLDFNTIIITAHDVIQKKLHDSHEYKEKIHNMLNLLNNLYFSNVIKNEVKDLIYYVINYIIKEDDILDDNLPLYGLVDDIVFLNIVIMWSLNSVTDIYRRSFNDDNLPNWDKCLSFMQFESLLAELDIKIENNNIDLNIINKIYLFQAYIDGTCNSTKVIIVDDIYDIKSAIVLFYLIGFATRELMINTKNEYTQPNEGDLFIQKTTNSDNEIIIKILRFINSEYHENGQLFWFSKYREFKKNNKGYRVNNKEEKHGLFKSRFLYELGNNIIPIQNDCEELIDQHEISNNLDIYGFIYTVIRKVVYIKNKVYLPSIIINCDDYKKFILNIKMGSEIISVNNTNISFPIYIDNVDNSGKINDIEKISTIIHSLFLNTYKSFYYKYINLKFNEDKNIFKICETNEIPLTVITDFTDIFYLYCTKGMDYNDLRNHKVSYIDPLQKKILSHFTKEVLVITEEVSVCLVPDSPFTSFYKKIINETALNNSKVWKRFKEMYKSFLSTNLKNEESIASFSSLLSAVKEIPRSPEWLKDFKIDFQKWILIETDEKYNTIINYISDIISSETDPFPTILILTDSIYLENIRDDVYSRFPFFKEKIIISQVKESVISLSAFDYLLISDFNVSKHRVLYKYFFSGKFKLIKLFIHNIFYSNWSQEISRVNYAIQQLNTRNYSLEPTFENFIKLLNNSWSNELQEFSNNANTENSEEYQFIFDQQSRDEAFNYFLNNNKDDLQKEILEIVPVTFTNKGWAFFPISKIFHLSNGRSIPCEDLRPGMEVLFSDRNEYGFDEGLSRELLLIDYVKNEYGNTQEWRNLLKQKFSECNENIEMLQKRVNSIGIKIETQTLRNWLFSDYQIATQNYRHMELIIENWSNSDKDKIVNSARKFKSMMQRFSKRIKKQIFQQPEILHWTLEEIDKSNIIEGLNIEMLNKVNRDDLLKIIDKVIKSTIVDTVQYVDEIIGRQMK